ncbi:hypothetical protein TNCV_2155681 [Trichonephila clavipes]|nr:hypothetical protein TNCV_2155681 [Trichonephila clavipes]
MNLTWRKPPAHHWYSDKSPGLSLQFRRSRALQTALVRFRSGHYVVPAQVSFMSLDRVTEGGGMAVCSFEVSCVTPNATLRTATAGSDVVQSGRPIFDDFFQHLWPYIGNNTANVVFQMVERLWLIRIDQ